MLTDLHIKNFAIIENLHVEFRGGLNVLTGETGAGKSIIIDAVNLIMGGRASSELIRTGEDEASVEAIFDVSGREELLARIAEQGIECEGELLVKRTFSRSGRNRVFVGGGLSTISALAELSRSLINIYGQHESQTLLKAENHLLLLDGFASLGQMRGEFSALFESFRGIANRLRRLEEGEREAARRIDLLSFQSAEITAASLRPDEEDDLEKERDILVHGEKLHNNSRAAFEELYGGDASILGALARVRGTVAEISAIDPTLAGTAEAVESAFLQLEDAALALRDYAARVESDPQRLQAVDDRLDTIRGLKKKYGPTIPAILAFGEEIGRELEELRNREETKGELERELRDAERKMTEAGASLSARRAKAARELKGAMERELKDLAMKHARFEAAMEQMPEPRPFGMERAEFLFSPNPGESLKPLARIASGGELSRLMLAIKQLHPESDVPTLVFDEVDSGIGGATSSLVGEKLKRVARGQQVLCITHLPQVAAFADHHLQVEKVVEGGRTMTRVENLGPEARVEEIARMLGGMKITDKTREHAMEMIEQASA